MNTSDDWSQHAACGGMDTNLFQIATLDDPEAEGLGTQSLARHNRAKTEKAQQACNVCPVAQQCYDSASPGDLYWSVRGGEEPLAFRNGHGKERRVRFPSFPTKDYAEYICQSGEHRGEQFRGTKKDKKGNYDSCRACKAIRDGVEMDMSGPASLPGGDVRSFFGNRRQTSGKVY